MFRPVSVLAALALLATLPAASHAQAQDPLAAPDARLNGTWKLDPASSDSLPRSLRSAGGLIAPPPPSITTTSGGAAGGGSGGRGGGGGRTRGGGGAVGGGGVGGSSRTGIDSQVMVELLAEVAPETFTVKINGNKTIISSSDEDAVEWVTDKKARDVASKKGSLVNLESSWWTKTLQTIRKLPDGTELTRNMKVSNDGKTLEIKENAKVQGKKAEVKLVYVRVEG